MWPHLVTFVAVVAGRVLLAPVGGGRGCCEPPSVGSTGAPGHEALAPSHFLLVLRPPALQSVTIWPAPCGEEKHHVIVLRVSPRRQGSPPSRSPLHAQPRARSPAYSRCPGTVCFRVNKETPAVGVLSPLGFLSSLQVIRICLMDQ